ncbi:MAG: phosphodiester glycosidase family protein [Treponema sp.]|nr:phosphodiester glycosidase family protein [Treponema sp.]
MTFSKRAAWYFLAVFFLFFLFASQSSALPNARARDFSSVQVEWKPLENCAAIQTADYRESQLTIHCAKIDLTAPGLKLKLLPKKEKSRDIFYAEEFAKQNGAILAFNTTPFYIHQTKNDKKHSTAGLCVNDGALYSRALAGYCAIAFYGFEDGAESSERCARIFASQKDKELADVKYAAGGFWQILKDKKIIQFKELRDSRTAVGLDASGQTLYAIAVEGENPAKSSGLTYMECADFLRALGCQNAMQFDGGSSTQFCVNGKSVLGYRNYVKVPAFLGFALE